MEGLGPFEKQNFILECVSNDMRSLGHVIFSVKFSKDFHLAPMDAHHDRLWLRAVAQDGLLLTGPGLQAQGFPSCFQRRHHDRLEPTRPPVWTPLSQNLLLNKGQVSACSLGPPQAALL